MLSSLFLPTSFLSHSLLSLRQQATLINCSLTINYVPFVCHSEIVTSFCPNLFHYTKDIELTSLNSLTETSLFANVIESFYGRTLSISSENRDLVLRIARALGYKSLISFLESEPEVDLLSFTTLPLFNNHLYGLHKDIRVFYKNTSFLTNSLLLVAFTNSLLKSVSCASLEFSTKFIVFTDEFLVREKNFLKFFNLIYGEVIDLKISNIMEFVELSQFFSVIEVQNQCFNFLQTNQFSSNQLVTLIKNVNKRGLTQFFPDNPLIFENCSEIVSEAPLVLDFWCIRQLVSIFDSIWVFKCLIKKMESTLIEPDQLSQILNSVKLKETELVKFLRFLDLLF
ncbi:hypothetical protein GEMRC1_006282 [Eukaryota sp. GEM-RC1]